MQLRVGGQVYKVSASATEEELLRLAAVIDAKLCGRPATPQNMFLAAMAIAHDLEEAQAKADSITQRSRDVVGRVLQRVDVALANLGTHTVGASPSSGGSS